MQFKLEQISPQHLDDFVRNPGTAYEYILADSFENPAIEEFLKMVAIQQQNLPDEAKESRDRLASLLPETSDQNGGGLQLLRKLADPKRKKTKAKAQRKQLFLEKDWHILHYALNGTTEGGETPMADAVLGLTEIPDTEGVMGYGPARYLTPEEVRAVARVLESVNPQQLPSRLNKQDAEIKHIYLSHTISPGEWDYLPEVFERFRDFYRDASAHGNAMLMVMY
jgi:hypothetical protein